MCLLSPISSFVAQKLLWEAKVAQGCSQHKKLLKTPKVAKKLPSTIYKGLVLITFAVIVIALVLVSRHLIEKRSI